MDDKVWISILMVVVFLFILLLFFLIKQVIKKYQPKDNTTIDRNEVENHPTLTSVTLSGNDQVSVEGITCFVEFLDVDNEKLNPNFIQGVLKNVSLDGVTFVCDVEYPIIDDMTIKIRFSLKDTVFILKGRIIRKELYQESDRFGYRVVFTNSYEEDRELLHQILEKILVEKRKKLKSNRGCGESMV
ncbi:PilZ domain-containing protein [Ornithinibacillus sp. BX22]|uniref:PilZ domain-containing protein n=2 Tax=Ornithinibacillus TaxID=484508 RepID=A0A923RJE0_9BACI|nr:MULTISPECIES: PilZ domain-containing protein [Ornithinibacillus]MBC5637939.1 PilZ domain-containing protein [Ornithinibacillus hominis]MBS3681697.1 PilZ domain-containing protein [Ornithinibacillus massiliensis]